MLHPLRIAALAVSLVALLPGRRSAAVRVLSLADNLVDTMMKFVVQRGVRTSGFKGDQFPYPRGWPKDSNLEAPDC